MFVTPEYNRSVPAVLKMHWMSVHVRMAKAFGIKPGLVVSVSPGAISDLVRTII